MDTCPLEGTESGGWGLQRLLPPLSIPLGPHPWPAATAKGTLRVTDDSTSHLQGPPRAA